MTVIITKGTFGWYDGKRVRPVTKADGPCSFDPKLEARLVSEGVAEWAGDPDCGEEAGRDGNPACDVVDDFRGRDGAEDEARFAEEEDVDPERDLEDMLKDELVAIAEERGIKVGNMKKSEIIDAIKASDMPPSVDAAEIED